MAVQELRHLAGGAGDMRHPHAQGLEAEVEVEGVLRALDGAQVAHQLARGLGDIGQFAEFLRVGQTVIGRVGRGQPGEFLRMGLPVEVAAVHDGSADGGAVAVHVLGRGVGDDVGAELEGPAVDRGREGVVDDQGHAVGVSDAGETLNVEHAHTRVGQRLAEDQLGVGPESGLDLLVGGVLVDEGYLDPHLGEGDAEEVVGAAVDLGGGDHVGAGLADVEAGEEVGGLPGRGQHRGHAALEGGDARGDAVVGRVLEPRVEVAGLFEVEETAHLVAGRILEGRALDDGHLAGFAVGRVVAGLDA